VVQKLNLLPTRLRLYSCDSVNSNSYAIPMKTKVGLGADKFRSRGVPARTSSVDECRVVVL